MSKKLAPQPLGGAARKPTGPKARALANTLKIKSRPGDPIAPAVKRHRYKPRGTEALKEIRRFQSTTGLLVQRLPFARLVSLGLRSSGEMADAGGVKGARDRG